MALIGAGKIGSALVQYRGFQQRGFDIVAIFDRDPAKVGQAAGTACASRTSTHLEASLGRNPADIAVLVTPPEAAQPVADRLVRLGVKSILNFAPLQLAVPADVTVKTVNLALELEALAYHLANPS